jgi:hypothetical protein
LFLFSATIKGLTTFGNTCTSVIHPIWFSFESNDHVLGIIKDGYKISVLTEPEECILKNNKSALDHSEFVESEISKLNHMGPFSNI